MKFERQTRRVMLSEKDGRYRVTFDSLRKDNRVPRDSSKHLVGISTATAYWLVADKKSHCSECAATVKEAWDAGDRYMLDTDEARAAAELVADLAVTKPDDIDICSALINLANEIAAVTLSNTKLEDFDIIPVCREALEKCFSIPEFGTWSQFSRRRRFMYELPRKMRTPVVYTIASLYFQQGAYPILTTRQQHELMTLNRGEGIEGAISFMEECIRKITEYKLS